MKDQNRIIISGKVNTDLKIKKYKDKESGKELTFVGFQLESEKKMISKREQPNNYVWINVYMEQAEFCRDYLSKDMQVMIEGTLETESWRDVKKVQHYKWFIKAEKVTCLNDISATSTNAWASSNVNVDGLETAAFRTESEQ